MFSALASLKRDFLGLASALLLSASAFIARGSLNVALFVVPYVLFVGAPELPS